MDYLIAIFLVVCSTLLTLAVQRSTGKSTKNKNEKIKKTQIDKMTAGKKVKEHTSMLSKKEVLKVKENVYVATGFGLANSIMIEGDKGVIIIDTLESCEVASEVRAEFEKITSKPIVGIILTHFHADHAYGTREFIQGREDEIPIYAHASFPQYYSQVMDVRSPITFRRAVRQFGTEIPEEVKENAGIGLNLKFDGSSTTSYVYPTITFSDKLKIDLAGIELELIHAPGETNDQIVVWYDEKRMLFPADNVYKAFPNLYAIRGTMHRDTLQWAEALDIMIDLKPETMVPQHTRPVYGEEAVMDILVSYRDAIQFVHDQTVRYMNKGMTGQEIADIVRLPPHLINHPYLIEYYGTVEWSVKAVYHGYIGWFSGRPADLHPLPKTEEANLYLSLIGAKRALEAAEEANAQANNQQALLLTDLILDADDQSEEDISAAKVIRSEALIKLSSREVSACGMNWYLTEDLVMKGLKIIPSPRATAQRIHAGKVFGLFNLLTCALDAEKALETNMSALFVFTDTGKTVSFTIRKGIAIAREDPKGKVDYDLTVTTTETVWRQIVAKERTAPAAALTGALKVAPGITWLGTFFSYFDLPNEE